MSFGDPDVETALRHRTQQQVHRTARRHRGRNPHHAPVEPRQVDERLSEDILITVAAVGRGDPLAGLGIEPTGRMPLALVMLGGRITLALDRHHVQQLRTVDLFQRTEHRDQRPHVVTVHRPEITEVETLEEIALLQQAVLDRISRAAAERQQRRHVGEPAPQPVLERIVPLRRGDVQQVAFQGAGSLVDSHVVVVENDQHVGLAARPGVVHPLESQAARHGAVADHGDHLPLRAAQLGGLGHTESGRARDRRMAPSESVVGTLGDARKAADAPQLAVGAERLAAPRDDLVRIGLMADVPHQPVVGRVENVMDRRSQLHRTEARRQMAGVDRALFDDIVPQLVAIETQFVEREPFEIPRRIHSIEPVVFPLFHELQR